MWNSSLDQGRLLSTSIFNLSLQSTSRDGIYAKHTRQINYCLILRKMRDWGKGLAVCYEKHNLLPSDVLPEEDNFLHCFLFSEMFLDHQQMFLLYEKNQSCYTDRGERKWPPAEFRLQQKYFTFFHHLSKEKQCFELSCAETSGVKKKSRRSCLFIWI